MMSIILKWKLQKSVVEMTAKWYWVNIMSAVLQLVMNFQVVLLTEIWLRTEECTAARWTQCPAFRITQFSFIQSIPFLTIDLLHLWSL